MTAIQIDLPDDLLRKLGVDEAERIARTHLVVTLYARGIISSGKVAELLGISRREALDLLSRNGLSVFDDTGDLEEEVRQARTIVGFGQAE